MSMADKCPYCGEPDPTILHRCTMVMARPADEHAGCKKQIAYLEKGLLRMSAEVDELQAALRALKAAYVEDLTTLQMLLDKLKELAK